MSDSDFVDVPSPSSSSHILSPTISMSTALLDQAQINDIARAETIIDRVPTPVYNVGASLGGDRLGMRVKMGVIRVPTYKFNLPGVEMDENIDGADRTESSYPDGGSVQAMLELDSFLPIVQALGSTLYSGVLASPSDHYVSFIFSTHMHETVNNLTCSTFVEPLQTQKSWDSSRWSRKSMHSASPSPPTSIFHSR